MIPCQMNADQYVRLKSSQGQAQLKLSLTSCPLTTIAPQHKQFGGCHSTHTTLVQPWAHGSAAVPLIAWMSSIRGSACLDGRLWAGPPYASRYTHSGVSVGAPENCPSTTKPTTAENETKLLFVCMHPFLSNRATIVSHMTT